MLLLPFELFQSVIDIFASWWLAGTHLGVLTFGGWGRRCVQLSEGRPYGSPGLSLCLFIMDVGLDLIHVGLGIGQVLNSLVGP